MFVSLPVCQGVLDSKLLTRLASLLFPSALVGRLGEDRHDSQRPEEDFDGIGGRS